MNEGGHQAVEHDRYKASSFRAYNDKLPERYDTAIALRILRPWVADNFVLDVLGTELTRLRILDVGCATGRLLERLAENGARMLAGSDLAPRILNTARAKLEGRRIEADLRPADAESSLPWPSGTFDVATLTGVLHHLVRPRAALAEIARVLRANGRLVLWDACFFPPARELMNACLKIHPHEGDYRFYTPGQARSVLTESAWDVVCCRRLSWWSYGICATPPAGDDTRGGLGHPRTARGLRSVGDARDGAAGDPG